MIVKIKFEGTEYTVEVDQDGAMSTIDFSGCEHYRDNEENLEERKDQFEKLVLETMKKEQAKLCESCPQHSSNLDEHLGEHTDECLAALDAIDKVEGI